MQRRRPAGPRAACVIGVLANHGPRKEKKRSRLVRHVATMGWVRKKPKRKKKETTNGKPSPSQEHLLVDVGEQRVGVGLDRGYRQLLAAILAAAAAAVMAV